VLAAEDFAGGRPFGCLGQKWEGTEKPRPPT